MDGSGNQPRPEPEGASAADVPAGSGLVVTGTGAFAGQGQGLGATLVVAALLFCAGPDVFGRFRRWAISQAASSPGAAAWMAAMDPQILHGFAAAFAGAVHGERPADTTRTTTEEREMTDTAQPAPDPGGVLAREVARILGTATSLPATPRPSRPGSGR
jgi:hypothetical protein